MDHWIFVIIAIALLAIHERLSASKHWFLGGILPLTGIIAAIYQFGFVKTIPATKSMIAYGIFFAATLLLWLIGRYEYKQAELKRMKAKDI